MGSLEHAPPFGCCGGLAFHATWCTGQGTDTTVLSAFRFALRTSVTPMPRAVEAIPHRERGNGFRAVRIMYGLTLREVADGWRVSPVELGELERGHRRFDTPADMSAALSQLWIWAVENNKEIAR